LQVFCDSRSTGNTFDKTLKQIPNMKVVVKADCDGVDVSNHPTTASVDFVFIELSEPLKASNYDQQPIGASRIYTFLYFYFSVVTHN